MAVAKLKGSYEHSEAMHCATSRSMRFTAKIFHPSGEADKRYSDYLTRQAFGDSNTYQDLHCMPPGLPPPESKSQSTRTAEPATRIA
jgi:hypothetical protein